MTQVSGFDERWDEIKHIWKSRENQWLYAIIGFVAGILLSPFLLTSSSVWADLFPEAIGILFTLVVIERIISARDSFNNARRNLVDNFDSVGGLLRSLFPYPTESNLNGLDSWIAWIASQRENRYKHLFTSERELSEYCLNSARNAKTNLEQYIGQYQQVEDAKARLQLVAAELKEPRKEITTILTTFFYKYSTDGLFEPISLRSAIALFQNMLSFNEKHLSSNERRIIQNVIHQIEGQELFNYNEILSLNLKLRNIGDTIFYSDCDWYLILEQAVSSVNQRPDYYSDTWQNVLHQVEVGIEEDCEKLPSIVIDAAQEYRRLVAGLGLIAMDLQARVTEFVNQVELLRREVNERS
jgi:hypothetical protein